MLQPLSEMNVRVSRLRVTMVIPTLDQSGAEQQLALLAAGLPADEFQVHVIALTRGGHFEQWLTARDIPVTVLGKRSKFDLRTLQRLRGCLQRDNPHIVHSWLFAANSYVRLLAGRSRSWKTVVGERCVDDWKAGWQRRLDRWLISRTDVLVGNSPAVCDFYRNLGYSDAQLAMVANAVTPQTEPPLSRAELLARYDLPADARLVGYVGRLAPQKGLKDCLWAMQLVRQLEPRAYLLVIGAGPQREELEHYARQLECAAHVRFAGHRADARRHLPHFEVFWLASHFEGMSNALMEAAWEGLPCVVSDIAANRELVPDNDHGRLIPVGDSVGRSQLTHQLLQQPAIAAQLGTALRQRTHARFQLPTMVSNYADLYRRLAASQSSTDTR